MPENRHVTPCIVRAYLVDFPTGLYVDAGHFDEIRRVRPRTEYHHIRVDNAERYVPKHFRHRGSRLVARVPHVRVHRAFQSRQVRRGLHEQTVEPDVRVQEPLPEVHRLAAVQHEVFDVRKVRRVRAPPGHAHPRGHGDDGDDRRAVFVSQRDGALLEKRLDDDQVERGSVLRDKPPHHRIRHEHIRRVHQHRAAQHWIFDERVVQIPFLH